MLNFASIREIQDLLAKKIVSIDDVVDFYIDRFKKYDGKIGAALEVFDKRSILEFSQSLSGSLCGIPGLIKDNICMKGRIASCASKILEHYQAPYTATVIERVMQAGGLCIGRGNMDEFAMGTSNETSAFQQTHNPWNYDRVAGGSSGGPVAAVAAGLVPWAFGSETGGSVRLPAAFCGVVGSKPTYGLVSRFGLIAYASSLDQVGVVTRTVYDNALVLSVIAGHDHRDATSLPVAQVDFTKDLTGKIRPGLKIGIIENAFHAAGIDPEISQALEVVMRQFEQLGAILVPVRLPSMDYSAATYFIMSRAEAASNLARFDGIRYGTRSKQARNLEEVYELSRAQGFGHEVKLRVLMGNYVLSVGHAAEYYQRARDVQNLMRAEFMQRFEEVDLLLSPVAAGQAFGFNAFGDNATQMDLQDYFTCSANLVGIPAVAVPCGFTKNKMPIGFQLMGPALSEGLIFQTAYAYEQITAWHMHHPQLAI